MRDERDLHVPSRPQPASQTLLLTLTVYFCIERLFWVERFERARGPGWEAKKRRREWRRPHRLVLLSSSPIKKTGAPLSACGAPSTLDPRHRIEGQTVCATRPLRGRGSVGVRGGQRAGPPTMKTLTKERCAPPLRPTTTHSHTASPVHPRCVSLSSSSSPWSAALQVRSDSLIRGRGGGGGKGGGGGGGGERGRE